MSINYDLTPDEAVIFFEEATELLESLDSDLVLIEHASDDELINRIFRAVHTLKGAAGSIGHAPMAHLAHAAETLLDQVRKRELSVTTELVDVLFVVVDSFKQFLEDVVHDRTPSVNVDGLVQRLHTLPAGAASADEPIAAQLPQLDEAARKLVEESLAAHQNVIAVYVEADPQDVAPLARLYQTYLQIAQLGGQVVASVPTVAELERGAGQRILVAVVVTELNPSTLQAELAETPELLAVQVADLSNTAGMLWGEDGSDVPEAAESSWPDGEAVDADDASGREDEKDDGAGSTHTLSQQRGGRTIRTSIERLDNLMNLAGELVMDRNRLFKIYEDLSHTLNAADATLLETIEEQLHLLNETVTHLSTVTDRLHDEVVKARMQPIETVFNKFPRLVRQIGQELGKQVELVVTGQDTEVDRSVIEQVSDPLLHLVRNAIDHGIETVEERTRAGKPPVGLLDLSARSEEGSIVITISDDGRGIDAGKVKQKAVSMGLISREQAATLNYAEVVDLIFSPGLSTATELSDLSGRGVGMDVVRSNIQRLNGSVVAYSTPGAGTAFELRLPLTLAIIPTLLVEVHRQVFALPLTNVLEIFKLDPASIRTVRRQEAAYVRGEILPLFRLSRLFGWSTDALAPATPETGSQRSGEFVVSLNHRDTRFGVVVEQLLGKQDVVIKSLGYPINNVRGLSGATLLGDGRIGLIADVAALVEMATGREGMPVPQVERNE